MIALGVVLLFVVLLGVFRPWDSDEVAGPQPWEYDAVMDQYWDPGHGHWHAGRPPVGTQSAPADPAQPRAWEYDVRSDRHWDPTVGQWHPGRPPLEPGSTPSASVGQPRPWEYDAVNDRYWHFDHWHDGPPPPAESR